MQSFVRWAVVLLVVLLCVHEYTAKGGRGGGRGGGFGSSSRGSSSRGSSWFSRSSTSHSSTSHSSTSHSTPSKGNWFTNLFRSSKPSSSSSSSSSSASKPASPPNYPRQPTSSAHDAPPSYNSLYPHSNSARPPSYGWATGAGATAAGGAHTNYHAPQATNFGAFTPQNHISSTSYHFIPIMMPHSHSHYYHHSYYGSRASPSSSASSSAANANETATTPKPLTAPIVYDMDTSALQPANERKKSSPALVLVVNNMVVYGDMQPGQNLVMVIDEHYESAGEIPARFLDFVDEDEVTDYNPPKRTTSTTSTSTTTAAPVVAT